MMTTMSAKGRALSLALLAPMSLILGAAASAQGAAPAASAGGGMPGTMDEVVVTGIRGSLATSIEQKRAANQIVDTITATDIGKLPDENIAESIQRITGVQITRSGGEGLGVNIRGLSAQTTINGRVGLGPGGRTFDLAARDYDYRNLAADFFQSVEVFKSPVASQPEGALGGTVNLVTRKPLDFRDRVFSVGLEGQYSDYVDKVDPRASAFFADQFLDDRLGVALSASYSDRHLRTDNFQALGAWQRATLSVPTGFDFNPADATSNQDVLRPTDLRFRTQAATRERQGVDASLQWKATDDLLLRVDGTYTQFENIFGNAFFRTLSINPTSVLPGTLQIDSTGSLLGARLTNQRVEVDGRYEAEPIDTYTLGGNLKWTRDRLTTDVDLSVSDTKRQLISQFVRFQGIQPATVDYRFNGTSAPPTVAVSTATGAPYDLLTPSGYVPNLAQDRSIDSDARETAARLDLKYDMDRGALAALSGGLRMTERDSSFRVLASASQAGNAMNPAFFDQTTGRQLTAADAPQNQLLGTFPFSDGIFPGYGGPFPRSWLVGNYPADGANGSPTYLSTLRIRDFGGLVNSVTEQSDIAEDTLAAYVSTDWAGTLGGRDFRANAGVRWVKTELTSEGVFRNAAGALIPVAIDYDYDDILPAANFVLTLNESVLLRVAGARVLQRPDLNQLATGYNLNLSSGVATLGNPLLEPFEADQFDISLEYYPTPETLLSAAVFQKDVKNFTANRTFNGTIPGVTRLDGGTQFAITQPVNGGGGTIKGFEVGVQLPFSFLPAPFDGFGVITNFTYSDSQTDSGQPIPRLSKESVNVIGYYERGRFSARAAYSWRSEYAETGEGGNNLQAIGIYSYVDAAGYLDASISYDVLENVTISLDAANLLDTEQIRYSGVATRLEDLQVTDRRITLGVRARF